MARFVILSFTKALDCLASFEITEDNLKDAIFCLGCTEKILEVGEALILKNQAPYQKAKVELLDVVILVESIKKAVRNNRVVWRRTPEGRSIDPSKVHANLSSVLKACNLRPLNPNLPPILDNSFLETAIERANNGSAVLVRSIY